MEQFYSPCKYDKVSILQQQAHVDKIKWRFVYSPKSLIYVGLSTKNTGH